ncbi:scaffold attachment factor B1-like [Bactrocera oleae]|uniref:scaffold attachment factor B1-like n=1 Tax=Bactrocera oleae TaxID=104688 RepID=UPI00387E2E1A
MAKFNDLKIPQLKKELQKRGLETKGVKSKLQWRLRRAMETKNINVEEYVCQSELEEETTKKQEKEVTQYSVEVMCAALESFFEDFSAQLSASKELDVHMSAQVSSQLEVEEACESGSSQYEEQEACILAQVSSQSEELNGHMPAQVSSQWKSFFESFSAQLSTPKELDVHMSAQVSSQLEEEEACEP